ncbi:hypothetical protein ACFSTI_10640 [Rhizorhabdus histidinilytica]
MIDHQRGEARAQRIDDMRREGGEPAAAGQRIADDGDMANPGGGRPVPVGASKIERICSCMPRDAPLFNGAPPRESRTVLPRNGFTGFGRNG